MNTCKTCKWWKENSDAEGFFRKCLNLKIAYDEDAWIESKDGAEQWGMDAGYVMFATGQDFGCVLHESKP